MNILMVDDEPYMLWLYNKLAGARHAVQWAHGYDEALSLIDEQSFDVIIVDLLMPARLESEDPEADSRVMGLKLCKEIFARVALRKAQVVVVSIVTKQKFEQLADDEGLDRTNISFCSKQPIPVLNEFIEKVIDLARSG